MLRSGNRTTAKPATLAAGQRLASVHARCRLSAACYGPTGPCSDLSGSRRFLYVNSPRRRWKDEVGWAAKVGHKHRGPGRLPAVKTSGSADATRSAEGCRPPSHCFTRNGAYAAQLTSGRPLGLELQAAYCLPVFVLVGSRKRLPGYFISPPSPTVHLPISSTLRPAGNVLDGWKRHMIPFAAACACRHDATKGSTRFVFAYTYSQHETRLTRCRLRATAAHGSSMRELQEKKAKGKSSSVCSIKNRRPTWTCIGLATRPLRVSSNTVV